MFKLLWGVFIMWILQCFVLLDFIREKSFTKLFLMCKLSAHKNIINLCSNTSFEWRKTKKLSHDCELLKSGSVNKRRRNNNEITPTDVLSNWMEKASSSSSSSFIVVKHLKKLKKVQNVDWLTAQCQNRSNLKENSTR